MKTTLRGALILALGPALLAVAVAGRWCYPCNPPGCPNGYGTPVGGWVYCGSWDTEVTACWEYEKQKYSCVPEPGEPAAFGWKTKKTVIDPGSCTSDHCF